MVAVVVAARPHLLRGGAMSAGQGLRRHRPLAMGIILTCCYWRLFPMLPNGILESVPTRPFFWSTCSWEDEAEECSEQEEDGAVVETFGTDRVECGDERERELSCDATRHDTA